VHGEDVDVEVDDSTAFRDIKYLSSRQIDVFNQRNLREVHSSKLGCDDRNASPIATRCRHYHCNAFHALGRRRYVLALITVEGVYYGDVSGNTVLWPCFGAEGASVVVSYR
jgi:hypothetical protein